MEVTMIALLALTLVSSAQAQSRRYVDPDYLTYLEQLGAIAALDVVGSGQVPQPELWDGMVGLVDDDGVERGTILVGGQFPHKQELWFMEAGFDPGAEFAFVHHGAYPPGEEAQVLAARDPHWDLHLCFNQHVDYVQKPSTTLTASLDYEPNIDRYHFELWQNGEMVGRMLREYHHVPNTPVRYYDHWAFFATYDVPKNPDEGVVALLSEDQFATTSAFFDDLNLKDGDLWLGFTQVQYRRYLGYQCLGGLQF